MLDAQLSHIALATGELRGACRFYEDVIGLYAMESTHSRARLALGSDAHAIELVGGRGLGHFALELDEDGLDSVQARLEQADVVTRWAAAEPGHPRALCFHDPEDHAIELHGRVERRDQGMSGRGRRPIGLHHITLSSTDVPALVGFYTQVLGFRVSDHMGERFAWLRCSHEHHTVAIVQGELGGLDHICFEVSGWEELKDWCDALAIRDVPLTWGPGRHGPGNNLFIMFDDPDGVRIELSCEMERFWDDRVDYREPRNWAPELRTINLWGPAPEWRRPLEQPPSAPA